MKKPSSFKEDGNNTNPLVKRNHTRLTQSMGARTLELLLLLLLQTNILLFNASAVDL